MAPDGGAQAADAYAYPAEHTALNGTAGDMVNYQSTGAAENGAAVTNEMGEPVPEPSYEEGIVGLAVLLIWYPTCCVLLTCCFLLAAVLSAEEARLWSVVTTNCLDFSAWTSLIEETEKNAEVTLVAACQYQPFL